MTSKVIQTITGNQIEYKVIKDGYKTISQTIDVDDSLPTRKTYDLVPSTVVHDPELDYTVDTDHTYPPVITFNENVVTPDDKEIATNKYILAPYGQDYLVMEGQQEDNFSRVGNVQVNKEGIISGFSTTNYIRLLESFNPGNNPWEMIIKIRTGSDLQTWQEIFHSSVAPNDSGRYGFSVMIDSGTFELDISTDDSSWIGTDHGTFVLSGNTNYWVKIGWNLNEYYLEYSTNGVNYTRDITYTSSNNLPSLTNSWIGIYRNSSYMYPMLGSIDLSESYIKINNEIWWQPTWDKLPNNYRVGGSVYVNNNIASNLTTWLAPTFTPTTDTWEFTTKIYTGSELTSHHNQILHNSTQNYAMAITRQGTSGTPMSSYINKTWTNGKTSLSANTWYWFRFSCTNKVCRLYITRFNNQAQCPSASSMTLQCTVTANASFIGNVIVLSVDGDQYWGGQIDLKQTQFIEGDRVWKYKDTYSNNASTYTYGTPNFYEGKMWGFSSSCYVNLPQSWRSTNNWEMVIKTKFNNFNTYSDILHTEYLEALEITTAGIVQSYNWQRGVMEQIFQAEINKDYWIKCMINGTTRTWFISEDDINYQQKLVQTDTGINSSANYPIRFGASSLDAGNPFVVGEFDLTECYLKINDELIWKGSERVADYLPGILDSSVEDTGDSTTYNLYDVETTKRSLILNNNRNVTVTGKQFVQYDGQVTIPDHGLSLYDKDTQTWTKYRFITLEVDDPDTTLYVTGNID